MDGHYTFAYRKPRQFALATGDITNHIQTAFELQLKKSFTTLNFTYFHAKLGLGTKWSYILQLWCLVIYIFTLNKTRTYSTTLIRRQEPHISLDRKVKNRFKA